MKLQVGDKVSFVNEKREGKVVRIINNQTVSVEIEDGFEIPVMEKDLIKIHSDGRVYTFDKPVSKPDTETYFKKEEKIAEDIEEDAETPLLNDDSIKEALLVAFEPVNQDNYLSHGLNMYFINKTASDVLFSCFVKKDAYYEGFIYDVVSPMSKYKIALIEKENLSEWNELHFQCLFFQKQVDKIKTPLSKDLTVNVLKFFKDTSFVFSSLLGTKSMLLTIHEDIMPDTWQDEEFEDNLINTIPLRNIKEMLKMQEPNTSLDKKHIVAPFIAEVDLHIENLVDDFSSMGKHDKFNFQMTYFAKCLDAAIVNKIKKITFIHGVGQGRLRQEIHKVIADSYPGIKIQDAPFKKFGLGATEVLIPFNLTK